MDIRNGDLPCDAKHVRLDRTSFVTLPDGRREATRTVYFIDRRGEEDAVTESWVVEGGA